MWRQNHTRIRLVNRITKAGCALPPLARERGAPAIERGGAQLLLDAEELVVLGDAVGARERADLDLAAVGGDGEVGDGCILGLAGAVRQDGAIARLVRQLDRGQGLVQLAVLADLA